MTIQMSSKRSDSPSSSSQQENETQPPGSGNRKPDLPGPGNRFEYKLLTLYALRAINFGYQFYFGTELPDVGDKFDDLIFHYKGKNDVTFRQQYLQAKYRLDKNKTITAINLLDTKNGDFSLLKYFQSFGKIRGKGNDIEHCIICTNVDFDQDLYKELEKFGMIVFRIRKSYRPNLLNCKDIKSEQACYKLKVFDHSKNTLSIRNCIVNCTGEEMKSLFQNCTEVVNGKPFNDLTADEMNNFFNHSAQNQDQVVQKLIEIVFDNFLDKLMFVAKTPNEDELDSILVKEVEKYFKLSNTKLQSTTENLIRKKTERHLRNLAIQAIEGKKKWNILIPPSSFEFNSGFEWKNEEKSLNDLGICYGLLKRGKTESQVQFLHKTYAEYLVADYIFNGFLLGDDQHNNLLENESARKWIIDEILVKDNYEGVRVFFDSMLKEIILKEEWKSRIKNNDLPLRLQQFATFLSSGGLPALKIAFLEINANIILFIFDCLDVTFHQIPSKIPSVIYHSLEIQTREPTFIFVQRIDVFDRLLNYFDTVDNNERLIEKLSFVFNLNNQQIEKKNLEHFLVFVGRHAKNDYDFEKLMVFFIHSKVEEETRRQFFEILASNNSTDFKFSLLMKNVINRTLKEYDCQIGEIEKTLTILRDLEQTKMATDLSRFLLLRGSETLKKEENENVRLSLENMGMTGLHGAVLRGDLKFIEKEIGCSLQNLENCSEEERKSVVQLMTNDEDLVPPLYLAAAYGHDDICKKTFRFLVLKKEISDAKGFLHRLLKDAIESENVVMIQTILKCVKEIEGQNDLVKLLQSVIHNIYFYLNKMQVKTITDIFMQETENGCRELNDLIFYNQKTLRILEQVECDVLQKMISAAGGFDNWIKRLMDTDLAWAFDTLSFDGFLAKFNQENQISKLIDILINKSTVDDNKPSEPSTSYWSDFLKDYNRPWAIKCSKIRIFLEAISKCASEEDLKRLLLYRDDKNILILLEFLIMEGRGEFNKFFSFLPENIRKEFENLLEKDKPKLIDHFISSPQYLESLDRFKQLTAIEFYLENGNEKQLSKFSQVVQVHHLEKNIKNLGYWGKEKSNKIAGLLKVKLDSQTVIKYNEFIDRS